MLLALGSFAYAGAQLRTSYANIEPTKPVLISKLNKHVTHPNDAPSFYNQASNEVSAKKAIVHKSEATANAVPCGSAHNLYGNLNANTTAVTCNQATGAILFTHRADQSKMTLYGSGTYEASVSLDWGTSWDTGKIFYSNASGSANGTRYPNGVIFNPAGNSTFTNAYWVASGPYTGGTATGNYAGWDSVAFGSMKFDSTNINAVFEGNGKPGVLTEEFSEYMSTTDDSIAHNIGDGWYYNSAVTSESYTGASVNAGKFNGSTFTWTQKKLWPHLMPSDHVSTAYDTIPEKMNDAGMAWSQDGKTGYAVIFGNLDSMSGSNNLDFVTYQPIVYKTTNSGKTWTMMLHNWRNDTTLVKYLRPTADSPSTVLPLWHLFNNAGAQGGEMDYDLVVDANNNLHIFGAMCASAIANPDSSQYISYFNRNFLFDCYTTSTGSWAARFIDSILSVPTQFANNGIWVATTADPLAMGNRIQATRTTDGKHIFVTWLDDTIDYTGPTTVDSMQFPDMYGQGYDVTTGIATKVKSFTHNTSYAGYVWYISVSDLPYTTGTVGNMAYHIPVVRVSAGPSSPSNDGTSPVSFVYDTTDVYYDNDFTGFNEISKPDFSISQNYPNPYNGITRFGINMVKEGLVSVDVYNLVGEKLIAMDPQKLSPGSHTVTINGTGLANGVYFYRVTVNGQSLTQKMIVE